MPRPVRATERYLLRCARRYVHWVRCTLVRADRGVVGRPARVRMRREAKGGPPQPGRLPREPRSRLRRRGWLATKGTAPPQGRLQGVARLSGFKRNCLALARILSRWRLDTVRARVDASNAPTSAPVSPADLAHRRPAPDPSSRREAHAARTRRTGRDSRLASRWRCMMAMNALALATARDGALERSIAWTMRRAVASHQGTPFETCRFFDVRPGSVLPADRDLTLAGPERSTPEPIAAPTGGWTRGSSTLTARGATSLLMARRRIDRARIA